MMLMLQAALEDRFQLRAHRETREMPAYVLTVSRGALAIFFRRPVVNRTGLTGVYDVQVDLPPLEPIAAADAAALDTPSVFTVLQEQLGLRVEEGRGPVDVLVIDHIERPTEN